MATRAPLYASVPYSALPGAATSSSRVAQKTVDELFDELDASDSGFSDKGDQASGGQKDEAIEETTPPSSGSGNTALQDAPSLFPGVRSSNSSATTTPPSWLHWTSSRATCSDSFYGNNEDKIDCIWLILGCLDGSVWIFCSLILQAGGASTPARSAAALRSSSQPNLLQSLSQQRPSISRKGSDYGIKRGAPPSPIASGSRIGTSSMAPSRAGSAIHGHSHNRKNRSISLALHGSSGLSGIATPSAPRKASATISVSGFDALGNESLNKDLPSPPKSPPARHSPSIHGGERPSFSFEELPQLDNLDYNKISFDPVARVYLDAQHSPVKSVKILQPEGATTPFLCLTENGCLYKLSCLDGTLLARQDLKPSVFPRTSAPDFGSISLFGADQQIAYIPSGSAVLSFQTKDLGFQSSLTVRPGSQFATAGSSDQVQIVELRANGHLFVSSLSPSVDAGDNDRAEPSDLGQVIADDEPKALGMLCSGEHIVIRQRNAVKILRLSEGKVDVIHSADSKSSIDDIVLLSAGRLAVVSRNLVRILKLEKGDQGHILLDFKITETILSASVFAQPATTEDCLILVTEDTDGTRNICLAPLAAESQAESESPDVLVAYTASARSQFPAVCNTASATLNNGTLAVADTLGQVAIVDLSTDTAMPAQAETALGSAVTCIFKDSLEDDSSILYTGTVAGQVAKARLNSGKLEQYHTASLFSSPVIGLEKCSAGILAMAADGSIAIDADEEDSWTLIPGSRSPLERLYLRQNQLLLVYSHGLARLWDLEAQSMQKTMDHSGVASLLAHMDHWIEVSIECNSTKPAHTLDLRALVDAAGAATAKGSKTAEDRLNPTIRWLLSYYCPDPEERYVKNALEDLAISVSKTPACSANQHTMAVYPTSSTLSGFTISRKVTARRLLTLVALLRIFLNFADTERSANDAIAFYSTQLGDLVGPTYKDASLEHLADFWLDESNEIRQAARLLFGARIGRLDESEVFAEVQDRQARMLQASSTDSKQLLVLGEIAIAKQELLNTGTIRDIAFNIAQSLDNHQDPACQNVSLELCIRGFSTFQNSFDAVKVLRGIFRLATSSSTDPTDTGLRNLARQTVLSIAALNAPLFMTVLSFDAVQNEADTDERARTMKLVAFMVRKKPIVLFASLPRLAEMVVRSLDPRSNLRGVLQQTATFILSELVKTYPSIAFHGKSQRLAVGTHEGAVVVYDLKTATRLYVLESHHKRASAVSYSPDGRRLVTVSLEESTVKVWKVGTSLLGLLTPAGPPPQGHGSASNEAYKTLDFKLASPEEAMMTAAAQLEWLTVEWDGDRRVKLTIRETALTFSVA